MMRLLRRINSPSNDVTSAATAQHIMDLLSRELSIFLGITNARVIGGFEADECDVGSVTECTEFVDVEKSLGSCLLVSGGEIAESSGCVLVL